MRRVDPLKVGLPVGPHVVREPRPWTDHRRLDGAEQGGPERRVRPTLKERQDHRIARLGLLVDFAEQGGQFREQWDPSITVSFVAVGLW